MNFVFHKQVCIWLHMVCRTIDGKCPEKKKEEERRKKKKEEEEEEECAVIDLLSGAKNISTVYKKQFYCIVVKYHALIARGVVTTILWLLLLL